MIPFAHLGNPSEGLDVATERAPGYYARVHEGAAEGTVQFLATPSKTRTRHEVTDVEKNGHDASIRAAGNLRRYAVHNQLGMHVTLTSGGRLRTKAEWHAAMKRFLADLRAQAFAGRSFPWLYVLERGRGRVHAHLLVPATFPGFFGNAWTHGDVVKVRSLRTTEDRRKAAWYLAKEFETWHEPGERRYRAGQGEGGQFRPPDPVVAGPFERPSEAHAEATAIFGRAPEVSMPLAGYAGTSIYALRWVDDEPSARRRGPR